MIKRQEELKLFRVVRYCSQREVLEFSVWDLAIGINFLMTLIRVKSCNAFSVWPGKAWTS